MSDEGPSVGWITLVALVVEAVAEAEADGVVGGRVRSWFGLKSWKVLGESIPPWRSSKPSSGLSRFAWKRSGRPSSSSLSRF